MLVSSIARFNAINTMNNASFATNKLLYNVAYLQEKMAAKHQSNQIKKSLNVLA